MLIAKKPNGSLCFSCEECSWTCDRPEELRKFSKGYEGIDRDLIAPTLAEIEDAGWAVFCVHEMEELVDPPERPAWADDKANPAAEAGWEIYDTLADARLSFPDTLPPRTRSDF
ncbi:MAG: hypothetical protein IID37_02500 [Planctomycetes bacterium]|nr:hypothetical protein [Planctomycetota bacterium]